MQTKVCWVSWIAIDRCWTDGNTTRTGELRLSNEVEPRLLDSFIARARDLRADLESGLNIDLTSLAQGMGSTLEYMLCELFSRSDPARAFWVDGVILGAPSLSSDRTISAAGYAWVADKRQQWKVPAHVHFSVPESQALRAGFLRIRIGDARLETLAAHQDCCTSTEPGEWLLEFDVALRGN